MKIEILVTRIKQFEGKDFAFLTFTYPKLKDSKGNEIGGGEAECFLDASEARDVVVGGMYLGDSFFTFETLYRQDAKGRYFPTGVYKLNVKNLVLAKELVGGKPEKVTA